MKISGKVLTVLAAILLLAVGIMMLSLPARGWAALTWLFALLVFTSGVLSIIVYCIGPKKESGSGFILAWGIINAILGLLLLSNLVMTAFVMTTLFAIWLIISAVQWISFSFVCKKEGIGAWWLFLILGIIVALLGIGAIFYPATSAGIITLLFGIGFIVHAVTLAVTAFTTPTIK